MGKDEKKKILVVEDEELMRNIIRELLESEGFEVLTADSAENAFEIFSGNEISATITDIRMSGITGIELLGKIKAIDQNALVIIITAFSSVDTAIAALRKGAYDYVTKPFVNEDLIQTVKNAIQTAELFAENRSLKRELNKQFSFDEIVGKSEALQSVFRIVEKVASTDACVLILGESGTGKELIARALHHHSNRADEPFVGINCGALPSELLESELFGHVKGAFTGANTDNEGLFRAAGKGSLFLDEIAEMPQSLQVKLLRTLQEQEIRPVGSTKTYKLNARIIAATNKNLEEEVESGNFREDLFYRLNVIEVAVPPLRDRREDIPLLIRFFLNKSSNGEQTVSDEVMNGLVNYRWPGNVRELQNAIERASILSGEEIEYENLPDRIKRDSNPNASTNDPEGFRPTLDEVEKTYIVETLEEMGNDKTKTAGILGIDLSTLYRKLKKYEDE